jgi:S-DNA-T family DNA segregation ATPase FtsK/SpoIIIE
MMESAGIIGPADGARPREILVDEDEAEEILSRIRG